MELKDIPWVGNVYQRLGEFCSEVEETMESFEDCVEACIEELMQDLLPTSWIPVTANNSGQGSVYAADVGTCERPEAVLEEEQSEMSSENNDVENETGIESRDKGLHGETASTELKPLYDFWIEAPSSDKDSDEDVILEETRDTGDSIARTSLDLLSSDEDSDEERINCWKLTLAGLALPYTDAVETTERESTFVGVQMVAEERCLSDTGSPNNWSMIEAHDVLDLGDAASSLFDSITLEESCVLVDKNKCPPISQQSGKGRSYKEKLRDALFGRKSSKSKDHEELSEVRQESLLATSTTSSSSRIFKNLDSCESDWVLL
ncbi:hypothetical protein AKJ16_DCAP03977 [Drosera capensis]